MKNIYNYTLTGLLALGVSMLLFSCGAKTDKKAELETLKKERNGLNDKIRKLEAELKDSDKSPKKSITVQVESVSTKTFTHLIDVHGKVESDRNVVVTALAAGTIQKVYVKRGQTVRKGALLAKIDSEVIDNNISEVQTQLDLANQVYDKQKKLWDQNIGTEVQYLQAKSNKESLEKRLATLNEQAEAYRFKAPIDGVVDDVMIKEGEVAAPGYPAFRIVNGGDFKIIAEIGEGHMSSVRENQTVTVVFPDLNKTIQSKITNVSQVISPLNRTFSVEIALPSNIKEVKANQIVYVSISDYQKTNSVVVPINVVQKTEAGSFVFVAVNNKVVKKTVKVGHTYRNDAEITEGLVVGDQVITVGYQELVEGQEINYAASK